MGRLEVLCTTMGQDSLDLVDKMNIQSDVLYANQCNKTEVIETTIKNHQVKMISTQSKGVGINRNISLIYSNGEIVLFSDDDMHYCDDYELKVLSEFDRFLDADAIIFNITSNSEKRKQKQNRRSKRVSRVSRLPYGAPRIAIRRSSWEKSNVWFTTLFGGGARYTSGEDSIFLNDLRKKGLTIYVSEKVIGEVNMDSSTWFSGRNDEYFFNKGAYCAATHPRTAFLWGLYYCLRITAPISYRVKHINFKMGVAAYRQGKSYHEVINSRK